MSLLRRLWPRGRKAELKTETDMPALAAVCPQEPPPAPKRAKAPARAKTTRTGPQSAAGKATGRFQWPAELDARLLELRAAGCSAPRCAEQLSELAGRELTANAIRCRLSRLREKGVEPQQMPAKPKSKPSVVPPSEQAPTLCEPPQPRVKRRTPAPPPPQTEDPAAAQITRIKRSAHRGEWRETDDHLLRAGIIILVNDAEARTGKPREWIRDRIAGLAQEVRA